MQFLRTPEERFVNLPGYNFQPNYLNFQSLRMHYVDEGEKNAPIVLMLHGEPSWSYLYRKMIPIVVNAGFRAIAPDLIGFGRSDKPIQKQDYSYQMHVDSIINFINSLDLNNIALVCQDWGGLIGLRVLTQEQTRFSSVVAANTGLPTGDEKMPEAFFQWQEFSQTVEEFPVGSIIQMGCQSQLSKEVIVAYEAPFPNESYKAGARIFPKLVPTSPNNPATEANRQAWEKLKQWTKPFLTAFSDKDPITRGADKLFQQLIPGAKDQPHSTITKAGHFLQEDKGEELASVIVSFIKS
ncbi:MAG: haloalkane dehalogenase [Acidobacteria bacterium]|nr:haloalkane dehalogenase [Acidobacteriota bacterium]